MVLLVEIYLLMASDHSFGWTALLGVAPTRNMTVQVLRSSYVSQTFFFLCFLYFVQKESLELHKYLERDRINSNIC